MVIDHDNGMMRDAAVHYLVKSLNQRDLLFSIIYIPDNRTVDLMDTPHHYHYISTT